MERDLQSLIERAIAYEWQAYVESMKTLPATGRPERVKLKFVLTFSVGVVMMVSVTSRTGSTYLSDDAYSSVKIGLWKFDMPLKDLASFILNFDHFESYVDEVTFFSIEGERCRFTHGPYCAAFDDDESHNSNDENSDKDEDVNGDNNESNGESGDEENNENDSHDGDLMP
jgi:hypothetical protein